MKNILSITWRTTGKGVEYFIDKRSAGFDEAGFKNILKYISTSENIGKVIIKYPAANNTGGDPMQDFPFYSSLDELMAIIAQKNISTEYEPQF